MTENESSYVESYGTPDIGRIPLVSWSCCKWISFVLLKSSKMRQRPKKKKRDGICWLTEKLEPRKFFGLSEKRRKIMAKTLVKLSDILLENCFWSMALTDVEFWVGWRINYSPVFSLPQFTGLPRSWLPIKNVNLTLGKRLELNLNLFHDLPLLMQIR